MRATVAPSVPGGSRCAAPGPQQKLDFEGRAKTRHQALIFVALFLAIVLSTVALRVVIVAYRAEAVAPWPWALLLAMILLGYAAWDCRNRLAVLRQRIGAAEDGSDAQLRLLVHAARCSRLEQMALCTAPVLVLLVCLWVQELAAHLSGLCLYPLFFVYAQQLFAVVTYSDEAAAAADVQALRSAGQLPGWNTRGPTKSPEARGVRRFGWGRGGGRWGRGGYGWGLNGGWSWPFAFGLGYLAGAPSYGYAVPYPVYPAFPVVL